MPPCQGGCREFEPRLPLIKKTHLRWVFFISFSHGRRMSDKASCVSELRLEQFCDWTKSKEQNAELPLNASEQDTSLVSRSIKKTDRIFYQSFLIMLFIHFANFFFVFFKDLVSFNLLSRTHKSIFYAKRIF